MLLGCCYWKKHQIVSIERDRPSPLKFWTKNRLFLRSQLSLKSKTITNQQRIGCLVYPEMTQISDLMNYWYWNICNKIQLKLRCFQVVFLLQSTQVFYNILQHLPLFMFFVHPNFFVKLKLIHYLLIFRFYQEIFSIPQMLMTDFECLNYF